MQKFLIYLLAINLITFFAMGIDKFKAKRGSWRIKENTLLIFVILGGGIGGIAGIYTFRHKTKRLKFTLGFPLILVFEIVVGIILYLEFFK